LDGYYALRVSPHRFSWIKQAITKARSQYDFTRTVDNLLLTFYHDSLDGLLLLYLSEHTLTYAWDNSTLDSHNADNEGYLSKSVFRLFWYGYQYSVRWDCANV